MKAMHIFFVAVIFMVACVAAMAQTSIIFSSISAAYNPPADIFSATWSDSPSNGKQWWSVFNTTGAKVASGSLSISSTGSYSITVQFTAPFPNKIMFAVCDNVGCKYGSYFIPSSGSPASYKATFVESISTADSLTVAPQTSGTPHGAPLTEISATADAIVILPRTCGIPESLVTRDFLAASTSSNGLNVIENLSDVSVTSDSFAENYAGNAVLTESSTGAEDAMLVSRDASYSMSESLTTVDSLALNFIVTFPQGCAISVFGNLVTCTIP